MTNRTDIENLWTEVSEFKYRLARLEEQMKRVMYHFTEPPPEPSSVSECKHKCEKHGQTNCIACYEPKPTTTPEEKSYYACCDTAYRKGENCPIHNPKPSVEKCDTITISRKVAEEFVRMTDEYPYEDMSGHIIDELRRALSKEGK